MVRFTDSNVGSLLTDLLYNSVSRSIRSGAKKEARSTLRKTAHVRLEVYQPSSGQKRRRQIDWEAIDGIGRNDIYTAFSLPRKTLVVFADPKNKAIGKAKVTLVTLYYYGDGIGSDLKRGDTLPAINGLFCGLFSPLLLPLVLVLGKFSRTRPSMSF